MSLMNEWYSELNENSVYQPTSVDTILYVRGKAWEFFRQEVASSKWLKFFGVASKVRDIFNAIFGPEV